MNTAEILNKVRQIEIRTGKLVSETFAGDYLSVFKGRGMEFAEVREYTPGDDIRSIDWNVTARFSRPFVKQFMEERELTLMVLCDLSGSQFFGSRGRFKNEAAADLAALFAFAALKNNDKTGLMTFTDQPELYIPPRKGRTHALRIIREMLAHVPKGRGTDIAAALDAVNKILKHRSILILISDFDGPDYDKAVRRAALRHDLIPVMVNDELEKELPALPAVLTARGLEDGMLYTADLSDPAVRRAYAADRARRIDRAEEVFRLCGVEPIRISTGGEIFDPVVRFFRKREKRK
jgi:uncharacterized protein (DUF58 family)